jgi:hypothetical protein
MSETIEYPVKITSDDNALDVIDKINEALESHGLQPLENCRGKEASGCWARVSRSWTRRLQAPDAGARRQR